MLRSPAEGWGPTHTPGSRAPVPASPAPQGPRTQEAQSCLGACAAAVPSAWGTPPQTQALPSPPFPSEALPPGAPVPDSPLSTRTISLLLTDLLTPRTLRPPQHRSTSPAWRPWRPTRELSAQMGSAGARPPLGVVGGLGLDTLGQPCHPDTAPCAWARSPAAAEMRSPGQGTCRRTCQTPQRVAK